VNIYLPARRFLSVSLIFKYLCYKIPYIVNELFLRFHSDPKFLIFIILEKYYLYDISRIPDWD